MDLDQAPPIKVPCLAKKLFVSHAMN